MNFLDRATKEVARADQGIAIKNIAWFCLAKAFVIAFIQLTNSFVKYVEANVGGDHSMEYPKEDK